MSEPVLLFETASNAYVGAVLHPRLNAEQVLATEAVWSPHRVIIDAEHAHWDWRNKVGSLSRPRVQCFGIATGEVMQGLMMVSAKDFDARLASVPGKKILYVDYIEVAPWNLRGGSRLPVYAGVGTQLMRAAIRMSGDLGLEGRVGLHSLPQSEGFYESGCGMFAWGQDPGYYGLMYYELSAESAARFLERRAR